MNNILIAPSMLAGDFARMGEEARRCEQAGADWLHLDVMDGCFVPNITFGPPVIAALRPCTSLVFDVHLMIDRPQRYLGEFLRAGADSITLHAEAIGPEELPGAVAEIHAAGKLAGLSLKPGTPAQAAFPYLDILDLVLVMTVEPGFGGQSFMADMLPKMQSLREEIDRRGLPCILQADGGITEDTIAQACAAGVNCIVAGSAIFCSDDPMKAVESLRQAASTHKRTPRSD